MSRKMKFGMMASSIAGQTMQLVGSEDAVSAFQRFYEDEHTGDVLSAFDAVCEGLDLHPGRFPDFFPALKSRLADKLSYRYKELWKVLEKRAKRSCYGGNKQCQELRVLVVGAGPCGLRTAVECQLLGARTVVVEESHTFSRNAVLELWKFVVEDLKLLGVKRLFSRLGTGSTDHISTKVLQTALLKICCLLGVQVYTGVKFHSLLEPEDEQGWHARLEPEDHEARHFSFDVVVGATGAGFCMQGFNRGRHQGPETLSVTASLKVEGRPEEDLVSELPHLNRSMHAQFFKDLEKELHFKIENFSYFRDDTHFYQFDVTSESLVQQKILKEWFECRNRLLAQSNVDLKNLKKEVLEVCKFATRYHSRMIPHNNFEKKSNGDPDITIHDFSNRFYSKEASKAVIRKGFPLLICQVGDSLANFPWEEGSGVARGILSCLDCCWMIRAWSLQANPLQVLHERENLYKVLNKLTHSDLKLNIKGYDLDPSSRYTNVDLDRGKGEEDEEKNNIIKYYDTDNTEELRYLTEKYLSRNYFDKLSYANIVYRYKSKKDNPGKEKATKWSSSLRKKTCRLRESFYLRFGKTEVTKDEDIEQKISQFRAQDSEVKRLNAVVENYVSALAAVNKAESDLFLTWADNIQDWNNLENFLQNAEDIKEKRTSNTDNLKKDVVEPLRTYKHQFREVKGRVDKCEQLRIEFDRLKFSLKSMQDNQKISKAVVDETSKKHDKAEDAYLAVLNELKQELPALYGVRREFFAHSLYNMFIQQNNFHNDLSYIYREMSEYVLIKLKTD